MCYALTKNIYIRQKKSQTNPVALSLCHSSDKKQFPFLCLYLPVSRLGFSFKIEIHCDNDLSNDGQM